MPKKLDMRGIVLQLFDWYITKRKYIENFGNIDCIIVSETFWFNVLQNG